MLQCNVFPGLPPDFLDSEVNLFLVPFMDSEAESENPPRAGMVLPQGSLVWDDRDPHWSLRCLDPFLGACFQVVEVREELAWV